MVDHRETILQFIREKGPTLPAALAKFMKMEQLFASAHLAELSENQKLKTSWLKIGGSPLYFLPDQQPLLDNFASNLNEKDKRAFDLLKQFGVVRDTDLEPLQRISLRNIKDFAVPLTVTHENVQEVFWRFHTLDPKEAERRIGLILNPQEENEKKAEKSEPLEKKEPKKADQKEQKKEGTKEAPKKEEQHELVQAQQEKTQEKNQEAPKKERKKREAKEPSQDTFMQDVATFLSKKNITIKEHTVIKKNTEIDCILIVKTGLGDVEFFAKAKNKKKIADTDISSTLVLGQIKKMPAVLIAPGELSKKASDLLRSTQGITFSRVE